MRTLILLFMAALAFAQNTAKFPGATASLQDLLVAKGPATATLAADLTDSATTISVTDGTQYAGFSAVQIESEVILVCTIAGNTLNVCPGGRGFSGTTAAAHITGRPVRNTITTHHHNQLAAEVKAVQEALGANLGNVAAAGHSHLAATLPATLVYNTDVYADPVWITSLAKSKVGLGSVENTALSTWAGSANITTLGTISSGTVPWARLSSVPTTFAPSAHAAVHASGGGDALSGTLNVGITGNAGTVTNGVYTTGSYSDPPWLTLSRAKVGLGSVENTALSTWVGSANITTLGTISSGTVPWARLSGVPATFAPSTHSHAIGDLSTVGDWSSKITSGTYGISITGSAAAATNATTATNQTGYGSTGDWNTDFQNTPAHGRRWTERNGGTNVPAGGGWWFIENMRHSNGTNYWGRQLAWGWEDRPGQVWTRNITSGTFGAWKQIPVAQSGDGTRVTIAQIGCASAYDTSCDPGGNGYPDYADGAGYAASAGAVAWSGVSAKPVGIVDFPISQAVASDDSASNGMALIQRRKGGGTVAPFWLEGTYRVGDILHWSFRVPQDYASGGAVTVFFRMASATSGNVQWAAYISCYASGYGASLVNKSFTTANYSGSVGVPGAAGYPIAASWALGYLDGLSVGHFCHIALRRESAASEATGNAEVTGFNFYYNR